MSAIIDVAFSLSFSTEAFESAGSSPILLECVVNAAEGAGLWPISAKKRSVAYDMPQLDVQPVRRYRNIEPTHHLEPIIAAKILLAQLNAPTKPANRFSKHFVLCALIACTGCSQGDI